MNKAVCISILLHLILIYLLSDLSVDAPRIKNEELSAIKSYIYFPPKVIVAPTSLSETRESKVLKELVAKDEKAPKEDVFYQSETIGDVTNLLDDIPEKTSSDDVNLGVAQQNKVMTDTATSVKTTIKRVNKASPSQLLNNLKSSIARDNASLSAEQHYNDYKLSQQTIAPSLTPKVEPFTVKQKKVDCSSNVNKGMTMLSGLMGGTIVCTKMPNVQPFVKARVDKLTGAVPRH